MSDETDRETSTPTTGQPVSTTAYPAAAPDTQTPTDVDGARRGPQEVNGTAAATATTVVTNSTTADGKAVTSQELFRRGDVSITREQVAGGDQYADLVVVNTGAGNDRVNVSQRTDGSLDVNVNGERFHVTLGPGQELGVRTGDGNDVVRAATNVTVNMDVRGGDGNDRIVTGQGRDRIDGGAGDDTIYSRGGRDDVFGNTGNDTINAGDGHDVVYGGDGNDHLMGGRGRDYIEGGQGNDTLIGGRGDDVLSGGQGDDRIVGQQGDDRVYTGAGNDTVVNRSGSDTVFGQTADDTITATRGATNTTTNVDMSTAVGNSIVVTGTPEFQQRVNADIDMLRNSPNGRQMLAELDRAAANGNVVTIQELSNTTNGFASAAGSNNFLTTVTAPDGTTQTVAGTGTNSTVSYNPSNHDDRFPAPVAVLYHELSHAYNHVNGTRQPGTDTAPGIDNGINNRELQAVGLNNSGLPFDFDNNPATPNTTANPHHLTENGLREEMGLPQRPSYNFPATGGWDGGLGPGDSMAPTSQPGNGAAATQPGNGTTAAVVDPQLERMLAAVKSGDPNALSASLHELRHSDAGQQFQQQGAQAAQLQHQAELERQQQAAMPQPEPQVSAGGMRR
jgi:hypothetical protein